MTADTPTLPETPERERFLAAMDRDIQTSGIPLSYPYRLWMLFVNPLWWISPGEEPRWNRAELWRRIRRAMEAPSPSEDDERVERLACLILALEEDSTVEWARNAMSFTADHYGDCPHIASPAPTTCLRCLGETYKDRARAILDAITEGE